MIKDYRRALLSFVAAALAVSVEASSATGGGFVNPFVPGSVGGGGGAGTGTVTNVTSASGDVTIVNGTSTPDLAIEYTTHAQKRVTTTCATTNQFLTAIGAAGTATCTALDAGVALDTLSNVNGAVLTRTAGTWGAIANVATANGALLLSTQSTPTNPASGKVQLFATTATDPRPALAVIGPTGTLSQLGPVLGSKQITSWIPLGGGATFANNGFENVRLTGTGTIRAVASTRYATAVSRVGIVSAAGAGSVAGLREAPSAGRFWLGNGAGLGGFYCRIRFMISDASLVATANMFVGLQASVSAPTDVAPSTLTNLIGVGVNNGDTVLQIYGAGGAAQARTALSASFPANTVSTDFYELILYAQPNASSVAYQVTRLNTGDTTSGTLSGANIPSSTTFLVPNYYRSNGGTASAVGIDFASTVCETDD